MDRARYNWNRMAYLAIPLLAAGVSFILWAVVSHVSNSGASGNVISGYSIGMTIYLPMSLGLPFILANFFRDTTLESLNKREFILSTLTIMGLLGFVGGLLSAIVGGSASKPIPVALFVSACVLLGSAVQQLGRIYANLGQFLLGISSNLLLPAIWLAVSLFRDATALGASIAIVVTFGLFIVSLFKSIGRSLSAGWTVRYFRTFDCGLIRVSLPLIPHLLAFAVIMQGVRMSASWTGSSQDIEIGHQVMLVLNAGVLVVASIHGVFSVEMMTLDEGRFRNRLRTYSLRYMFIGSLASVAVMVAFLSPLRLVMEGIPRFDLVTVALMASVPVSVTIYNFLATILMRFHRTKSLAFVSLMTLALWILVFLIVPAHDITSLLICYCLITPLLFILALVALCWRCPISIKAIFSCTSIILLSFLPALGLFFAAL